MTTEGDEVVFPAGDEIEGFWNLDKMHAPRPVSPLSFDLIVRTLAEGFTKAHEDYDCPIMVSTKEINHYLYFAFHPLPDDAEVSRRMEHYHEKLAEKVPMVGRTWEEVWKPAVIDRNVALKTAPWSDLTDAELVAKLDELTDYMRYQWWIHGHVNFVLLSSSAFCDLYDKVMQPVEPTEAYRILQGFPTTSVDAAKGLWALSRIALTSPVLSELFEAKQGVELLAALDETDEGREFRRRLDEFLFEFGWRHDAVYDLADVPWHEDPSIPMGNIRAMMPLPESEDPELQYQANVAAREALFTRLRARLADDPDTMAKLDELYRRRGTASRSPKITPSTSTRCTSPCSAVSSSPSVTGSSPRACSTSPTTSSTSTATSSSKPSRTASIDGPWLPGAGRASNALAR